MQTIEFHSNYGPFSYRMTAEIGDDVNPSTVALAKQGMANICYRTVGSNVDKALGVKSKKNGGDGRSALLYSEQDGETINAAVSKKLTELEAEENGALKPLKLSFAVTGQYVPAEAKPSKEATEVWVKIQALPEPAFATALEKLGLTAEDYDDDRAIAAIHKKMLEAKRAAAAAAAATFGV